MHIIYDRPIHITKSIKISVCKSNIIAKNMWFLTCWINLTGSIDLWVKTNKINFCQKYCDEMPESRNIWNWIGG
jgi:hypothetical protein